MFIKPDSWAARGVDLVVGAHPSLRSRVSYGLHPILIYLAWICVHVYSSYAGYMTVGAAKFMIAHNLVGMVAFYPLVRSGYSARFQDSGLIQPQMMWAASSTIICYALNPPLRAALMQMLCFIHLFGLFTLRPRQLIVVAVATIGMLFAMLGVMASLDAAHFNTGQELFKVAFASLIIGLLTWMSILHARPAQRPEKGAGQRGRPGQRTGHARRTDGPLQPHAHAGISGPGSGAPGAQRPGLLHCADRP
ncbi:MAG: hypothetical protein V4633_17880 [Pseudomonadota bacterium]